ncbi:MAG: FIVAR domain-containing protein, partial [Prevotellaceae bacterium]|nr:FIVAR domain-containing protein [Prevotellaceae bacterium]
MKKNLFRNAFTALAAVALMATTFVACSSDDDQTEAADKTALQALVTESETLANSATTAEYPQAAIDAFKSVITAAKAILANESATQTAVDNIVTQLTEAKVTFEGNKYEAIPASNLLIGLSFDEGAEATTQLTA